MLVKFVRNYQMHRRGTQCELPDEEARQVIVEGLAAEVSPKTEDPETEDLEVEEPQ
jgi:hypothetical protein